MGDREKVVEIRNVSFDYGDGVVLDDISMDVFRGEIVTIVGGSGCGKSTLLRQITGLLVPGSGSVKVLGHDLTSMDENEMNLLHRKTGMLFQNGALLGSATIGENVSIPLDLTFDAPSRIIERIVLKKLDMVGLADAYHKLPSELSGGMRKRAALARAIALDPEILLADEPSAGLDPVTVESLDHLLLDLREILGMSIVVVTHDVSSIMRIADRIIFLEDGRVLFEGNRKDVSRDGIPESVAAFFKNRPFTGN